ncbi:uncharacterized protein LOC122850373 [Aphidius gifuensis]|uniref:uncharacterized protein LOC122850373 n=1 Tax=Aphidius gifuensis TaxID=684658 RepID=UPI001CDD8ADE|nr:uncharacterized protein LOC122850373 [Aphidius gifuensis]
MFPELQRLYSLVDDNGKPMTADLVKAFDTSVGQVINIIVSYDMGWSKRGNCRSYDSLNGYGSIIGFSSKKILDFATRNRKCKKCDNGYSTDSHDCRKNHYGSAKSMEASIASQLVNNSKILESNESSSGNGVISHLKKCFAYALAQNAGDAAKINEKLYAALQELLAKYANNSSKFSVDATSQLNEMFNGMVARKMPKIQCYSMSASADYRVASAVLNFNDGEQHVMEIEKKLNLTPGTYTAGFAKLLDKIKRILVAKKRKALKKKTEKSEGIQYQSNCGIEFDDEQMGSKVVPSTPVHIDINTLGLLDVPSVSKDCHITYIDIKTSGFHKSADILQIAARCENHSFSVYISPTQTINQQASDVTGLRNINGQLYFNNKKVITIPLRDALLSLHQFLKTRSNPCLLVAHNASFDAGRLFEALKNHESSLSSAMVKKISKAGVTYDMIEKAYLEKGEEGVVKLLSYNIAPKQPRVIHYITSTLY